MIIATIFTACVIAMFALYKYVVIKILCFKSASLNVTSSQEKLPGVFNGWDMLRTGLIFSLGNPNYLLIANMVKIFGSVNIFRFNDAKCLVVTNINLAKKICSSPAWTDRLPEKMYLYERTNKKSLGLLFGNGKSWEFCRNFTLKTLQLLGFYDETNLEDFIAIEIRELMVKLDAACDNNEDFQPTNGFNIPTFNQLMYHLAGVRFSHDDPKAKMLLNYNHEWQKRFNLGASALHAFNWLRYIPRLTEHDIWLEGNDYLGEFFQKLINEKKSQKAYLQPNCLIDHFLQQMELNTEGCEYYTDEHIRIICIDLFIAGADTTSFALEFAILYMVLNPYVQEKVQQEIENVIGNETAPSLIHKSRMSYTEATSLEIFRLGSVVPVTGRCPLQAAKINETTITRDYLVGINIFGIHRSPDIWTDPELFKPERFLTKEGNIINTDKIMPFGHGKRRCIGEVSSRKSFFLFFTSLLQKYSFKLSSHHPPLSLKHSYGLGRYPQPYFVSVSRRFP